VGEKQNQPFQLSFNASLKVDFQGSRVTSDGGLVLMQELDERLGLSELIDQHLPDIRGRNTQLPLAELLPRPSERLCTQKPGWSIAYWRGWEYVIGRLGSQNEKFRLEGPDQATPIAGRGT